MAEFLDVGGTCNKVRVTRLLGGSHPLGVMSPKVGMSVYQSSTTSIGKILSLDSGNFTCIVGVGTGSFQQRFYTESLFTTEVWATGVGNSAWPTGDNSVLYGHHGIFPNGVPSASGNNMDFYGGDSATHTFSR